MPDFPGPQKRTQRRELFQYQRVGLEDIQSGEFSRGAVEITAIVHRHYHFQLISEACQIILAAVTGSGMHQPRAVLFRNVLRENDSPPAQPERMRILQSLELRPFHLAHYLVAGNTALFHYPFQQIFSDYQLPNGSAHAGVDNIRVRRHRDVSRQRPGSSRPDHQANAASERVVFFELEPDVNGR